MYKIAPFSPCAEERLVEHLVVFKVWSLLQPSSASPNELKWYIKPKPILFSMARLDKVKNISAHTNRDQDGELYRYIANTKGVFAQPAFYEAFWLIVVEAPALCGSNCICGYVMVAEFDVLQNKGWCFRATCRRIKLSVKVSRSLSVPRVACVFGLQRCHAFPLGFVNVKKICPFKPRHLRPSSFFDAGAKVFEP
ncbi:hypothetical protein Bca52824_026151 [Brassica carinata]|uniref:sucrose synthase n=1 Tax=Brassica carinata TaxID=52824 RepID=A0A8X7SHH1_BRACI|nr:hypothetical protein Bca52824_026151 [Brassica carinata]